MGERKMPLITGETYHCFNRGVDKRDVFMDQHDVERFFQSMREFNVVEPIGSIYENSFGNKLGGPTAKLQEKEKLVDFHCYCLNPNHFHFILTQRVDGGISEFMKRIGGYTWYFNNKYNRSGALFQGKFKSIHINSDDYLLYLSAYVNLNDKVHQLGGPTAKLVRSSWGEYVGGAKDDESFCDKKIILEDFNGVEEYKKFARETLKDILEKKKESKEISELLLE